MTPSHVPSNEDIESGLSEDTREWIQLRIDVAVADAITEFDRKVVCYLQRNYSPVLDAEQPHLNDIPHIQFWYGEYARKQRVQTELDRVTEFLRFYGYVVTPPEKVKS